MKLIWINAEIEMEKMSLQIEPSTMIWFRCILTVFGFFYIILRNQVKNKY